MFLKLPALAILFLLFSVAALATNPWDKEVVYQIFPRSFRDSNGDRIGDFKGIEEGLPYLHDLGITAILINPIYKARVYHNYFADDIFDTDPAFGTVGQFKHLVKAAHDKGIKVILDIEPQYIANKFPWLADAIANPDSKYRDYFTSIPKLGGKSNWYNGADVVFSTFNFQKQECIDLIHRFANFWADTGIDGMRIDHMMDDLDFNPLNTDLFNKLWKPIEDELKTKHPGFFFIAEQSDWESWFELVDIFNKTPTDAVYGFRTRTSLLSWNKIRLEKQLQEANYFSKPDRTVFNFLENHDLERWASSQLDPRKQRLGAVFIFTNKGVPMLYYGQEIGMKGIQGHWNSDGNDIPVRLAFRWGATLNAPGTSTWYKGTGPWDDPSFSHDHDGISVAEQEHDPDSLLAFYKSLIQLRKSLPALSDGDQSVVQTSNPDLVVYRRHSDKQDVVVAMNLSEKRQEIEGFKVRDYKEVASSEGTNGGSLSPYGYAVFVRRH